MIKKVKEWKNNNIKYRYIFIKDLSSYFKKGTVITFKINDFSISNNEEESFATVRLNFIVEETGTTHFCSKRIAKTSFDEILNLRYLISLNDVMNNIDSISYVGKIIALCFPEIEPINQ